LLNRHAHAKQLLERGADPNVVSASGNTSLHIAAMRGQQELTRLLLEHGADPTIRDTGSDLVNHLTMTGSEHSGRTPAQWASINHHVEVVDIIQKNIEEHADSGTNEQNESGDNRDNRELFCENGELLNSGIKALDFFSPVPRGGLVRVPFKSGVGMVVLLGELSHRFFSCESGVVVWTGFTQPPFDLKDWEADMSEFGMKQHVLSSLVSFKENASKRRESYQTGLSMIEAMRDAGRDVLAIVLSTEGFENDVEESLIRLSRLTRTGSVTSIVMTPFRDVEQAWDELKPPYSAQITLDYRRALKSLFPAIDPDRSMSNALDSSIVGLRHAELLGQVRELFAWYRTLDPDFELLAGNGDAKTNETDNDQQKIELVQRLLRFFCQPFMTAEPFSGKPGEFVTRSDLLDGLGEILSS
jgi:F-type H+-transporting ATPase subunit beta